MYFVYILDTIIMNKFVMESKYAVELARITTLSGTIFSDL